MSVPPTRESIQQRFGVQLAPDEDPLQVYTRYGIVFLSNLLVFLVLLVPAGFLGWWIFHPNPYNRLDRWLLAPLVVYLVWIVAFILYRYVDWRNDALILTNQRLVHVEQTLLFSQMQREAALGKVQNVRFAIRGFVPRILDFGSLQIETAARGSDISFSPIRRPQSAQRDIMARVEGLRAETSAQLMRQTLLHRLDPEHNPPPQSPALTGESLGQHFASRLHLPLLPPNPIVAVENITWHKHGYFLFLRILRALALLAVLAVAAILFAS